MENITLLQENFCLKPNQVLIHRNSPYCMCLDPNTCPSQRVALVVRISVVFRCAGSVTKLLDGLVDRHVVREDLLSDQELEFVLDVGVGAGEGCCLEDNHGTDV